MIKSLWWSFEGPLMTLLAALILCVAVGGPAAQSSRDSSVLYLHWATYSVYWSGSQHRHPFYCKIL